MSAIRKSEFAKRCNVSAPCVSQWISGGKIDGAALVGEGRSAMIDVDIAHAQLNEQLDPNSAFRLEWPRHQFERRRPAAAPAR